MMTNLDKAKNLALYAHPFFATILLHHEWVEVRNHPSLKTMGTNGKTMFFNPDWTESLPVSELVGVLCHEAMHVALGHQIRARELADQIGASLESINDKHNIATDFVINAHLAADNVQLPEKVIIDDISAPSLLESYWPTFCREHDIDVPDKKLTEMTSEEVFRLIPDPARSAGSCMGVVLPCTEDPEIAELDNNTLVMQAATIAKQQGKMPSGVDELINKLTKPQVNWKQHLWEFMTSARKTGYTFTRRNRRYIGSDIAMPSFGSKGMAAINFVLDSSGSMSTDEFRQGLSEINGAAQALNIRDVLCVVCDARVQAVHHRSVSDGEIIFNAVGRGGTDMAPAFEELKKHRPAPTVLITDGYLSRNFDWQHSLMTCITTEHTPSGDWGKILRVKV